MASENLQQHYASFYASGEDFEWRRLGAIDKADNIVRAWRSLTGTRPRVVEIGCGDGAIAARLAELDFFDSYLGFDISESGIGAAKARAIVRADFAVSGFPIPLKDDSADVVIMSHVIEHLEHPRQLIREARRIAPLLIAEVPLELNRGLRIDYDWNPVGHINKYSGKAIRQLIQTCQFDVLAQFTTNPSRDVALFHTPGIRSSTKWVIKQSALRVTPNIARSMFTFHETLIAQRNERTHPSHGVGAKRI
ncbi:bifunctional 2-polyprenyl-6-hydroxyphenol methylase/3-demethylubiquinol 3-O-methyltransferase UbiG [Mycobacterium sp. DL592]|uniref:class I SAM-dependent methyltransferase n=1 Tax=Mycobacterium sp. DL592 TaxID=2675524 RepID=UPI0014216277|nr:class I SAM-dependent methyltransferase [Mycobacterium sp. DL592]